MDAKLRTEVTEAIRHELATVKALAWGTALLVVALLCVFVRTDNFRKAQNKSMHARISENTEAITADSTSLAKLAIDASKERAELFKAASDERKELQKCLDELAEVIKEHDDE